MISQERIKKSHYLVHLIMLFGSHLLMVTYTHTN